MPDPRVRVLVINPKLTLAVGIKTALDALDGFSADAFTSSLNALEFARKSPPHAAVLDLMVRSPGIAETVVALRKLNPKIKLLLTSAPDEAVLKLRADGLIALPTRAREIEPIVRALFPSTNKPQPGTSAYRTTELRSSKHDRLRTERPTKPAPEEAGTKPASEITGWSAGQPHSTQAADDLFERIASEEPPIPTGMEGGTVREAVRAMLPRKPFDESMYVVEITSRPSDTDEDDPIPGQGEWRALTPAEALQEQPSAAADQPPAEAAASAVEPADGAPSPVQEMPESVELGERLADEEPDVSASATAAPTKRNTGIKVPALPSIRPILPTGQMPPIQDEPSDQASRQPAFDDTDADLDEAPASANPPVEAPQDAPPIVIPGVRRPPKKDPAPEVSTPQDSPPIVIPGVRRPPKKQDDGLAPAPTADAAPDAPRRALTPDELRQALILTHEEIGTTAAALILTGESSVLAHSGEMPTQEIEELERVIGGDWEVRDTQARVRYITLPTSRQEYMLHTRRTENGYALSMAFAGDLPISEIRTQSDAIARTLHAMRPDEAEQPPAAPQTHETRVGLTAVWMLKNPAAPLTADLAQAVVIEFDRQLRGLGWAIHAMNVHADFVYVYCDVQTTYLASEVLAELKHISAAAICARRPDWQPADLWADAYMVLMPGRELGSEEVESFLTFTRTRLHRKGNDS